jgi:hypothetical protein
MRAITIEELNAHVEHVSRRPRRVRDDVWTFPHGKHKGLSVDTVFKKDPSYFQWMIRKAVHFQWPGAEDALRDAGLLFDGDTEPPQQQALVVPLAGERSRHRKLAHDKYVPVRQRGPHYGTVSQRSRASLHRSLKDLLRSTPIAHSLGSQVD